MKIVSADVCIPQHICPFVVGDKACEAPQVSAIPVRSGRYASMIMCTGKRYLAMGLDAKHLFIFLPSYIGRLVLHTLDAAFSHACHKYSLLIEGSRVSNV